MPLFDVGTVDCHSSRSYYGLSIGVRRSNWQPDRWTRSNRYRTYLVRDLASTGLRNNGRSVTSRSKWAFNATVG
jgi:hypothetical protein